MTKKSSFREREKASRCLIDEMTVHYWESDEIIRRGVFHVQYGYETHIPETARRVLANLDTPTAKFVRFAPDFLLIRADKQQPTNNRVVLLEYKVTLTPRYKPLANVELEWYNIGQIEAAAWLNYETLSKHFEIALLIYCPYHPRPLLCDILKEEWKISEKAETPKSTDKGSRTAYFNINLAKIAKFEDFMSEVMGVETKTTISLLNAAWFNRLRENPFLQVRHDEKSPHKGYETGFNWEQRYKEDAQV